ncbi:MAG: acyl-ACP--UDP-N-acetylglucosamine O-acyltransferase [Planctomycetes bacterium]|nr:acyl-ACP--UDP-N-acetylglucosamine O-acyltransferase [Planctomycetota bacterium]
MATRIHPTAIIDASARLGEDVEIGPGVIVEADTVIGAGCRILGPAVIRRYTTVGAGNVVHPFVVLGGEPQDYSHDPSVRSFLQIGNGNVFREGATVSRATGADRVTVIGDNNYFMTCAHAGHNADVGNNCVLANGSGLGGYARIGNRTNLSAHASVHQFCWVGEIVMMRGNSGASMHVPPYCMLAGINLVVGLNRVGLRRTPHIAHEDRSQISEAFRLLYRSGLPTSKALTEMDAHTEWGGPADKFRQFVRDVLQAQAPYNRGLCTANASRRQKR